LQHFTGVGRVWNAFDVALGSGCAVDAVLLVVFVVEARETLHHNDWWLHNSCYSILELSHLLGEQVILGFQLLSLLRIALRWLRVPPCEVNLSVVKLLSPGKRIGISSWRRSFKPLLISSVKILVLLFVGDFLVFALCQFSMQFVDFLFQVRIFVDNFLYRVVELLASQINIAADDVALVLKKTQRASSQ
jgi:hypothetical protein